MSLFESANPAQAIDAVRRKTLRPVISFIIWNPIPSKTFVQQLTIPIQYSPGFVKIAAATNP
jgi:hypothetical protein